jgi:hypothetical protein
VRTLGKFYKDNRIRHLLKKIPQKYGKMHWYLQKMNNSLNSGIVTGTAHVRAVAFAGQRGGAVLLTTAKTILLKNLLQILWAG